MTIRTLTENRKELAKALASITGRKMQYQGPPTFIFTDGSYVITRNGDLEVEDFEGNIGVLKELAALRLIDDSWDEERNLLSIDLPMEGHGVTILIHLLQIVWSKEELISKAVGMKACFKISKEFIEQLIKEPPTSVGEFLFSWNEAGGEDVSRGLAFDEEGVHFTGFPFTEDDEWIKAYMDLAAAIWNEACITRRVKFSKPDVENEKYYFRVWLVRLGFDGDEYSASRKKLLSSLDGNSAFRTEEQKLKHAEKYRRGRE